MDRPPGKIQFQEVSKSYGEGTARLAVLRELSFSVRPGEFLCLLGPSGCGKSTILHLLAGFIRPTRGKVTANGLSVSGPGIDRGVVFQRHSLFPWKTVRGNIAVGPRMRGLSTSQIDSVVNHYLGAMGLADFAARFPRELSVGMQQRVGLGRAFANDPDVLLMDEPFGSLDAQTRLRMQEMLLYIWNQHKKTVVFVTHDVEESLFLADRILLLSARPAVVREEFSVDLPRPRGHDILTAPAYIRLKKRILEALFDA